MHFDDHESQVPVSSSPLQFQHFTMPVHEKRDTSRLIAGTQKPFGSQLAPVYQNGYPAQVISFDVAIPGTPYPAHMAQVPNLAVPQVQQHYGAGAIQQGSWNQHNILLDASNSAAKKRSLLLELPHLIGYMVGMMAIFGLYLIIPMMILLNATLPDSWNKLMIAASILVIGEIAICVILVKTIPRRKSKHKHKTHRRDALARPYQRT